MPRPPALLQPPAFAPAPGASPGLRPRAARPHGPPESFPEASAKRRPPSSCPKYPRRRPQIRLSLLSPAQPLQAVRPKGAGAPRLAGPRRQAGPAPPIPPPEYPRHLADPRSCIEPHPVALALFSRPIICSAIPTAAARSRLFLLRRASITPGRTMRRIRRPQGCTAEGMFALACSGPEGNTAPDQSRPDMPGTGPAPGRSSPPPPASTAGPLPAAARQHAGETVADPHPGTNSRGPPEANSTKQGRPDLLAGSLKVQTPPPGPGQKFKLRPARRRERLNFPALWQKYHIPRPPLDSCPPNRIGSGLGCGARV